MISVIQVVRMLDALVLLNLGRIGQINWIALGAQSVQEPIPVEGRFNGHGLKLRFLEPLKPQLQSMAVESTFNWYWLLDGLRAQGYPIDLANPAKIEQYKGIKHADDLDDAYHLAELQRLKILPKAHVYDPELRPVRDLLRRRSSL